MTEQQALLAEIISNPDDDTVRLAYADWLEEHDDPHRAAFIRAQVEYAKYEKVVLSTNDVRWLLYDAEYITLFSQSMYPPRRSSSQGEWEEWGLPKSIMGIEVEVRGGVPDSGYTTVEHFRKLASDPRRMELKSQIEFTSQFNDPYGRWNNWLPEGKPFVPRSYPDAALNILCDFSRGFVESVTCTTDDWFRHADGVWWHRDKKVVYNDQGEGQITYPCPLTAQPLRKVTLTTSPVRDYSMHSRRLQQQEMVEIQGRMILGPESVVGDHRLFTSTVTIPITAWRDYSSYVGGVIDSLNRQFSPPRMLSEWFKGIEFEIVGDTPPLINLQDIAERVIQEAQNT